MAQITYVIGADTTEIVAKLDEVVRAFNGVGKSAKDTERKVKKTTDTGSKGAKKLETGFISLKEGAEGFGGEMGAVAGRIDKFAKSAAAAGSAMGPWGMGIAAVTLGLGGLAWGLAAATTAAVEFVSGADDMIDRLGEIAGIEAIPDRTTDQISEFNQMMLAAEAATTEFKVLVAGELSAALTDAGYLVVGLVRNFSALTKVLSDHSDKLGTVIGFYDQLYLRNTTLGKFFGLIRDQGTAAARAFAEETRQAAKEVADLAKLADEHLEFGPSPETLEKESKRRTAIMEAQAQADIKLYEDAQAAKKKAAEKAAKERAKIAKIGEDELRKMQCIILL